MIRFLKAAFRGVQAEYSYGAGWVPLSGSSPWASLGGITSKAGTKVSAKTSLEHSAVWSCVRKTAEMVATLPVDHYRKGANGSRERMDDDLAEILKDSPNRGQTAFEFWEGMIAQQLLQGNAYAERLYLGKNLVGLRPLLACAPERMRSGDFRYGVIDRGKKEYLPADKVFHLRGFGAGDGLGMSVVRYGANSIGAALAADHTAGSIFSNAAMPGGVLNAAQKLDADQRGQLKSIMEDFTGSNKAGKTLVLEAGLTWQQLQMNPEDAQLLDTRRYSIEDVCRWFGTPPIVIGHTSDGQTMWGSGVEAILLSWLTLGVNPLLTRLEKRIKKDLIAPEKRRKEYVEFNREAMIQMDSKAKAELVKVLALTGTNTANERRQKFNLENHADPNANALLAQAQMTPLELLGKDER